MITVPNPKIKKIKLKIVLGYLIIQPATTTFQKFQYGFVFFMGIFFIISEI